jgi:hypothetical protein
MVVVELPIILQRGFKFGRAGEMSLPDQLTDATIETLDHAVCLWMPGRRQTVLHGDADTGKIKGMLAGRLLVFGSESVGKLRSVVGQYLGDLDGRGKLESTQEIDAAHIGHVGVGMQKYPARGAVDGNE